MAEEVFRSAKSGCATGCRAFADNHADRNQSSPGLDAPNTQPPGLRERSRVSSFGARQSLLPQLADGPEGGRQAMR